MGFSDKMREGLGAEGVHLSMELRQTKVRPGATFVGWVDVAGGTKSLHLDAFVVRLVQAIRHWRNEEGQWLTEDEVGDRPDRRRLEPVWKRTVVQEHTISVNRPLDPQARDRVDIELWVPESCRDTTLSCTYMLNVQAAIKGQIDPSANANVVLGED